MPVEFYLHTPLDNTNERRALYRVARLLHARYGHADAPHFLLVGNIDPKHEPQWQAHPLTQLDGLLFGEQVTALLEFKNYPDPIDGELTGRPWRVRGTSVRVEAGSALNPYQQAIHAHRCWANFMQAMTPRVITDAGRAGRLNWNHLNGYVLFHPQLHPRSSLLHPGNNHLWLAFGSTDDILQYVFSQRPQLQFTPQEMRAFATQVLNARPWLELQEVIDDTIGYLAVTEPDGSRTPYPVSTFDLFTVGRSRHHRLRLDAQFKRASGSHLQVESQLDAVRISNLDSRHGTWVNGVSLSEAGPAGQLLNDGDLITLGGPQAGPTVAQIQFSLRRPGRGLNPPADTTETTEP